MKMNFEGDKCARCLKGIGEIAIFDDDNNTLWVCEECDAKFFETNTTFIIQEIKKQIRHHEEENNQEAIASLNYVIDLLVGDIVDE